MNGTDDTRADRHALLEPDALLAQVLQLRDEGGGVPVRARPPWVDLYDLRNHLAHRRLPEIDEALVRRTTWLRVGALRDQTRARLR